MYSGRKKSLPRSTNSVGLLYLCLLSRLCSRVRAWIPQLEMPIERVVDQFAALRKKCSNHRLVRWITVCFHPQPGARKHERPRVCSARWSVAAVTVGAHRIWLCVRDSSLAFGMTAGHGCFKVRRTSRHRSPVFCYEGDSWRTCCGFLMAAADAV